MSVFDRFEVLSFDVYGTLIDFEGGILEAMKPVLKAHSVHLSDEQILEVYGEIEARIQDDEFIPYREVLRNAVLAFGERFGFMPSVSETNCLLDSFESWRPFPDVVESLEKLKQRFQLAILSNVDDALFAVSAKHLDVAFDWVITSQQARSYKPSAGAFEFAVQQIGVSPEKILHISNSMYHDIIPARAFGLSTLWVNGRPYMAGFGAIPPVSGCPDFEVPDLQTMVSIMGLKTIEKRI